MSVQYAPLDFHVQLRRGFIACLVVAASTGAYGGVLGLVAAKKGIAWYELLVMNLTVFAGSSQFVMVDMWHPPLAVLEITLAVLVINMRYMLIGASLNPLFQGRSLLQRALFIHLVADENWAITMARFHREQITVWFLLGGGLCVEAAWCAGTMIGHSLGSVLPQPEKFGLDFAFVAVFTALVFSFWRGKKDILPWIVTAILAFAVERLLPGRWYILAGGVGGALAAALMPQKALQRLPEKADEERCDG